MSFPFIGKSGEKSARSASKRKIGPRLFTSIDPSRSLIEIEDALSDSGRSAKIDLRTREVLSRGSALIGGFGFSSPLFNYNDVKAGKAAVAVLSR